MYRLLKIALLSTVFLVSGVSHAAKAKPAAWEKYYADSESLYTQGQPQRALAAAEKALQLAEQANKKASPEVGLNLRNVAQILHGLGRAAEAEKFYKRSIEVYEKALGPDHPEVADALDALAFLYSMGRLADNEPLYKRALAIREKAFGADSEEAMRSVDDLASFYKVQRNNAQAEIYYKRLVAYYDKHPSDDNYFPHTFALEALADIYKEDGKTKEAQPLYERVIAIVEKARGKDYSGLVGKMQKLSEVYRKNGRAKEADALDKRIEAISKG